MPTIGLTINEPEDYISGPAVTFRFKPRDLWAARTSVFSKDATTGQADLWLEPISGVLMLRPVYDGTRDTNNDNATTSGGTWAEVDNLWGTACTWMHQTDATATDTYIESTSAFEANTNLYVDLFLHEDDATDYKVAIEWGGLYKLEIYRDGQAALFVRETAESEWTDHQRGRVAPAESGIFEQRLRLAFVCANQRTVAIASEQMGADATFTGLSTQGAPATEGVGATDPATIFEEAKCRITVSDGAYVAGIRPFLYPASGSVLSPLTTMQEYGYGDATYTGTPTLSEGKYLPTDTAVAHSIRDADGDEFGESDDKSVFKDRVELTAGGSNTRTPWVAWSQVEVETVTTSNGATATDISAYVSAIHESLALDGYSHNVSVDLVPEANLDFLPVPAVYSKLTVDGTPRTAFYLGEPEYTEWETWAKIRYTNCENRLLKLKHFLMSDAYVFDGMLHTAAVAKILQIAGVPAGQMTIAEDPLERRLPMPEEGEEPLFRWQNGTTAFEAVQYICDVFSGWGLYIDGDGKFVYSDIRAAQEPAAKFEKHVEDDDNRRVMSFQTKMDASQCYNQIWVVGEDVEGNVLVAYWENPGGWQTADVDFGGTTGKYLAERRKLLYIDPALTTQTACNDALTILIAEHQRPVLRASIRSWYDPSLRPGQWVELQMKGIFAGSFYNWRIDQIDTEITQDGATADYQLTYINWA